MFMFKLMLTGYAVATIIYFGLKFLWQFCVFLS